MPLLALGPTGRSSPWLIRFSAESENPSAAIGCNVRPRPPGVTALVGVPHVEDCHMSQSGTPGSLSLRHCLILIHLVAYKILACPAILPDSNHRFALVAGVQLQALETAEGPKVRESLNTQTPAHPQKAQPSPPLTIWNHPSFQLSLLQRVFGCCSM